MKFKQTFTTSASNAFASLQEAAERYATVSRDAAQHETSLTSAYIADRRVLQECGGRRRSSTISCLVVRRGAASSSTLLAIPFLHKRHLRYCCSSRRLVKRPTRALATIAVDWQSMHSKNRVRRVNSKLIQYTRLQICAKPRRRSAKGLWLL